MHKDNVDYVPWLEYLLTCRVGSYAFAQTSYSPPNHINRGKCRYRQNLHGWAGAHPTVCVFKLPKCPLIVNSVVGVVHEPPLQKTTINATHECGAYHV
jgi:hypothetical protein